jgi:hypothetical protein
VHASLKAHETKEIGSEFISLLFDLSKVGRMINKKKYGILLLQVSIILMAFFVVPALAYEPPIILEGNLMVDGSPAAVGTKVTIVSDGNTIAETTVTNEGVFGDERSNRLGVRSDSEIVTVYVNGVETQTLDLSDYQTGDIVSMDLAATTPVSTETKVTSTSGGGGGFGGVANENIIEEENPIDEEMQEETALSSTLDETALQGEIEPVSTSQSSNAIVLVGIVLIVAGLGIYMYRAKK